jgi:hypothetical protein
MKLLAAPLIIRVSGQAFELQRRLALRHFVDVEACPLPTTVDNRIAKGPTVWSCHSLAVVGFLVLIVMALKTGKQRTVDGTELSTSMFAMTINATEACRHVRRNYRRRKCIGRVT